MKQITSLSDEEVVELVRSKDQELYVHLVNRYQEKLLRYAVYLIGDEQMAQDAVQTALIKAFQNLQGFNTDKKFSSWLYRIAHNEAINTVKKNHREKNLQTEIWQTIKSSQDVESEYDRKEMQVYIKKSLDKLPNSYKAPLTLFYLEERSYEDISDILRLPIGTVGTRINRGKKILKNIMSV